MVNCQLCGRANPPHAPTCHQCGIPLGHDLLGDDITLLSPNIHFQIPPVTLDISPSTLSLHVDDTCQSLSIEPEIYIGRDFSEHFFHPHLDLQPFGGWKYGISRIHARLEQDSWGCFYIVDLDSSNGTWLNDDRLTSSHQYLLRHNDVLRIGRFPISIHFGYPYLK